MGGGGKDLDEFSRKVLQVLKECSDCNKFSVYPLAGTIKLNETNTDTNKILMSLIAHLGLEIKESEGYSFTKKSPNKRKK